MKRKSLYGLMSLSFFLMISAAGAEQGPFDFSQEACQSWTPAMVGGPLSQDRHLLTMRWLGCVNMELTYKGQVILLSNYYDRGPRMPSIGFTAEQVVRADLIFLGQAHFDHMSDTASIALRTGALVFGHQTVADKLLTQGVPSSQIIVVKNGDVFHFDGFTVEAIHVLHSSVGNSVFGTPQIAAAFAALVNLVWEPPTPEQAAAEAAIAARGSSDPKITTEGTFAYLFTFGKDFRYMFYDSMNPILTDETREVMQRIGGRTDVATVGYQGPGPQIAVPYSLPAVKLFNPRFFIPGHQDPLPGFANDIALHPFFEKIMEELPGTEGLYLNYRQPICFNVEQRGYR